MTKHRTAVMTLILAAALAVSTSAFAAKDRSRDRSKAEPKTIVLAQQTTVTYTLHVRPSWFDPQPTDWHWSGNRHGRYDQVRSRHYITHQYVYVDPIHTEENPLEYERDWNDTDKKGLTEIFSPMEANRTVYEQIHHKDYRYEDTPNPL